MTGFAKEIEVGDGYSSKRTKEIFNQNFKDATPEEIEASRKWFDHDRWTEENQDHKIALAERDREIERLRQAEEEIKETLLMARRLSEDLQGTARREADLIMGEARLEAQQVINQTHDEHRKLLREVMRLRGVRHQLVSQIRAVVEAHSRLVDECEELVAETNEG